MHVAEQKCIPSLAWRSMQGRIVAFPWHLDPSPDLCGQAGRFSQKGIKRKCRVNSIFGLWTCSASFVYLEFKFNSVFPWHNRCSNLGPSSFRYAAAFQRTQCGNTQRYNICKWNRVLADLEEEGYLHTVPHISTVTGMTVSEYTVVGMLRRTLRGVVLQLACTHPSPS